MRLDSTLAFVPIGAPLSIVGATGASFASNIIDLLGSGVGTAPANIIGNAAVFGEDIGVGGGVPEPTLNVVVGTVFATSDSATLNVQLQAAADNGASGTPPYNPATWTTIVETGPIAAATLTAGRVIARFDIPPTIPENLNPRFYRLNFVTPSGTQFTTGTISSAYPTYMRDDQANKNAASNYKVS